MRLVTLLAVCVSTHAVSMCVGRGQWGAACLWGGLASPSVRCDAGGVLSGTAATVCFCRWSLALLPKSYASVYLVSCTASAASPTFSLRGKALPMCRVCVLFCMCMYVLCTHAGVWHRPGLTLEGCHTPGAQE